MWLRPTTREAKGREAMKDGALLSLESLADFGSDLQAKIIFIPTGQPATTPYQESIGSRDRRGDPSPGLPVTTSVVIIHGSRHPRVCRLNRSTC